MFLLSLYDDMCRKHTCTLTDRIGSDIHNIYDNSESDRVAPRRLSEAQLTTNYYAS